MRVPLNCRVNLLLLFASPIFILKNYICYYLHIGENNKHFLIKMLNKRNVKNSIQREFFLYICLS